MSNTLVFYHANCSDGSAAAAVCYKKMEEIYGHCVDTPISFTPGEPALYFGSWFIPVQYGELKTAQEFEDKYQLKENKQKVTVLDFSFNNEIHNFIKEHSSFYTWIDHHKTALQDESVRQDCGDVVYLESVGDNHRFLLDISRSGAMLAWKHFFPNYESDPAPKVIQHVQDRDLWKFQMKGTKELGCFLHTYSMSLPEWQIFLNVQGVVEKAIEEGGRILEIYDRQIKSLCKKATTFVLDGEVGLGVNTGLHVSEVGNLLAEKSGTFGAMWFWAEDKVVVSLRSTGDYDVSSIARRYGGGGHKNAAGFSTDLVSLQNYLLQGLALDRRNENSST